MMKQMTSMKNTKKQNAMNEVICMNPWDIQSKHVFDISGICETLYAGECRWGGGEHYVCYAIEGNVVDRISSKNGKGWCENVSPTLNTQDRHAVCFQLCGDRDNPSVSVSDKAYCIPANPMSDRGQAVCYERNEGVYHRRIDKQQYEVKEPAQRYT